MKGISSRPPTSRATTSNRLPAMPMHTRSTTRRIMALKNGAYAFTSPSEMGGGIHTHFKYADCYSPGQSSKALGLSTGGPNFESSFSSNHSATTPLASSVSSLSSRSGPNQFISPMFDGSFSPISSSSSWDSYHYSQQFVPPAASTLCI